MQKLNNRGFAISSIMYMILILGVILITLTLSILNSRKLILDKLKKETLDEINYNATLKNNIGITKTIIINENNSKSNFYDFGDNIIDLNISLPSKESSIKLKIEITNLSELEMGIYQINGIPDNLEYELEEYILKNKICNKDDKCKNGIKKAFYITIKYKENVEIINEDINIKLNFDFRQFYNISYEGINNNNYQENIISGDTLNVTFINDIPQKIKISVDNSEINTYTYESGNLTISNVTNNLKIEKGNYVIDNNFSNVSSNNNETEIKEGSNYKATLTSFTGYEIQMVTVTMGGTDITSSAYSNGSINIENVMGDISITATASLATYEITNTLTNVSNSNTQATIKYGESYSATLISTTGQDLDAVTVTMGGTDITSSAYSNGSINIENVIGDISITATSAT